MLTVLRRMATPRIARSTLFVQGGISEFSKKVLKSSRALR